MINKGSTLPTGQSQAYSLANTDLENLDLVKGYINGRFGAIPFLKEVKDMAWLITKESMKVKIIPENKNKK